MEYQLALLPFIPNRVHFVYHHVFSNGCCSQLTVLQATSLHWDLSHSPRLTKKARIKAIPLPNGVWITTYWFLFILLKC